MINTRASLLQFAQQRERSKQIGDRASSFSDGLSNIEKSLLVLLSEAARSANHSQIALNSVTRAQQLERSSSRSFELSHEFASVLWAVKEQKTAVDYLREVERHPGPDLEDPSRHALLLSRLVSAMCTVIHSDN